MSSILMMPGQLFLALYSKKADGRNTMKITQGHSNGHRPDLKQFLVKRPGIDRAIPVSDQTDDGNASDKAINSEVVIQIFAQGWPL